jgi:hypothetical protein
MAALLLPCESTQAPFVLDSIPGGRLYGARMQPWKHPIFQLCPQLRTQLRDEPSGETGETEAVGGHTPTALVGSSAQHAGMRQEIGTGGASEAYTRAAAARPPGSHARRAMGVDRTCLPGQPMEPCAVTFAQIICEGGEHVLQMRLTIS